MVVFVADFCWDALSGIVFHELKQRLLLSVSTLLVPMTRGEQDIILGRQSEPGRKDKKNNGILPCLVRQIRTRQGGGTTLRSS